jgi:Protein of unknown function (DUF2752)
MSRQLALLWGAVAGVLLAASPWASAFGDALWECTFKSWTGIPCPTCGTARAAVALARLDVLEALSRYPLPALAWIFLLAGGLGAAAMALLGRQPPQIPSRIPVWGRVAIVAAVLGNWMYSIATGV